MSEKLHVRTFEKSGETRVAVFSPCKRYRYLLEIVWDESKPLCNFIGLNPSTADELKDDPTIRRCKGFAKSWGCGGLLMTNLFGFRATDPREMKRQIDPIGKLNTTFIIDAFQKSGTAVAAWGAHGSHMSRGVSVLEFLRNFEKPLEALKISKDGHPCHPLYLPANSQRRPLL